MALRVDGHEIVPARQILHALEAGQYDMVPHIVHAPIFLQSVRDSAITGDDMLGNGFPFAFFPHHVGKQGLHQLADIAGIIHLPLDEVVGYFLHQQFLHLGGIVLVAVGHPLLIFLGGQYPRTSSRAAQGHDLSLVRLDKLIAQHPVLKLVDLRLAYYLIGERVIEEAGLRNDMLYLVGRGKELGQGNGLARIGRTVTLLQPSLVAQHLGVSRPLRLVRLRELAQYLPDSFQFFLVFLLFVQATPCAILVDAQRLLLGRRIGTHALYLEVWVHEFCQQSLDTQIVILVLLVAIENPLALLGRVFHVTPHLYVYLVHLAISLPDVPHHTESFQHYLLHDGVTQ